MNKKQKKILAIALGLFSFSKNFNQESHAITAVANKEQLYYDISKKSIEQVPNSSSNNNNFKFFSYFKRYIPYLKKYAPQLKFAGSGMAAFSVPIIIGSLLSQHGKKQKRVLKKNVLEKIDKNPFSKVIPHYQWQNGNCFFLSSLYTLFGPENQAVYDTVSKSKTELVESKVIKFCKNHRGYEVFINEPQKDASPVARYKWNEKERKHEFDGYYTHEEGVEVFKQERRKKVEGFVELCKLFNRQKNFTPNESFNILPKDFKGSVLEFEEKLCGQKLLTRSYGAGSFDEVINCFTSEEHPFLLAFGDKSIFVKWAFQEIKDENENEEEVIYDQKIRFTLPTSFNEIKGEVGRCEQNDENVELGEDGKITVNGQNYYLVSISQTCEVGEGHIICVQPKYSIDEKSNISLSAALKLNCSTSNDELYKCDKISDIINFWGSTSKRTTKKGVQLECVEYCFRFAPESAIRQYQDYYCIKN